MSDPIFNPSQVRYIKLGRGGGWAQQGIDGGTIPFGYNRIPHEICLTGNWDEVRARLISSGRTPSGASHGVREIREFYALPSDTLWVTVASGHLWWAFADQGVCPISEPKPNEPSRFRRTKNGWSKASLSGEPLTTLSLSSALTRTANFRMTLCEIERADYLLRRIRGEPDPLHAQAVALKTQMRGLATRMVAQLHWRELENLIDLIFTRDGWRRVSVLGQDQHDVDLLLEHSTTRQSAWVQVKTSARQSDVDDYLARFRSDGGFDRFYFVCGKPSGKLILPEADNLQLWTGDSLSEVAIDSGLFEWLIDRAR